MKDGDRNRLCRVGIILVGGGIIRRKGEAHSQKNATGGSVPVQCLCSSACMPVCLSMLSCVGVFACVGSFRLCLCMLLCRSFYFTLFFVNTFYCIISSSSFSSSAS